MGAIATWWTKQYYINDSAGSTSYSGSPAEVYYSGNCEVTACTALTTGGYEVELKLPDHAAPDMDTEICYCGINIDGSLYIINSMLPESETPDFVDIACYGTNSQATGTHTATIGGKIPATMLQSLLNSINTFPFPTVAYPSSGGTTYHYCGIEIVLENDVSIAGITIPNQVWQNTSAYARAIGFDLDENTLTLTGATSVASAGGSTVYCKNFLYFRNGSISGSDSFTIDPGLSNGYESFTLHKVNMDLGSYALDIANTESLEILESAINNAVSSSSNRASVVSSQIISPTSIKLAGSDYTAIAYRSYLKATTNIYHLVAIDSNLYMDSPNFGGGSSVARAYDSQISITDTSATAPLIAGHGLVLYSGTDDVVYEKPFDDIKVTEATEIPDPPEVLTDVDDYGGGVGEPPSFVDKIYDVENETDPHYYAGLPQPAYFRKLDNWDEEYVTYYVYKYGQLKLKEPIEDLIYRVARMVGVQPDLDEKGRETIIDALDAAVQMICTAYDWNFMKQKTTLEVKQGVYEYNLEEEGTPYPLIDCYRIRSIRYNDDDYSDFLTKRDYQQIERQIATIDIDTGRPDEYALFTPTRLFLNKIPDADYDLQVIYQRRHPSIQVLKTLLVPDFLVPAIVQLAKEIYKSESARNNVAMLQIPVVQQLLQNAMAQDADMQYDDEGAVPYSQLGELDIKIEV